MTMFDSPIKEESELDLEHQTSASEQAGPSPANPQQVQFPKGKKAAEDPTRKRRRVISSACLRLVTHIILSYFWLPDNLSPLQRL